MKFVLEAAHWSVYLREDMLKLSLGEFVALKERDVREPLLAGTVLDRRIYFDEALRVV